MEKVNLDVFLDLAFIISGNLASLMLHCTHCSTLWTKKWVVGTDLGIQGVTFDPMREAFPAPAHVQRAAKNNIPANKEVAERGEVCTVCFRAMDAKTTHPRIEGSHCHDAEASMKAVRQLWWSASS